MDARDMMTGSLREGLELNAAEAWDYLAGGEVRRCFTGGGEVPLPTRVRDGQAEVLACGEWVRTCNGKLNADAYTIAPDEPAAEQALADLPPNPQRDSWVRGEMAIGLDAREAEARQLGREARELAKSQSAQLSEARRNLKDAEGKLETLRSVRTDICKALGLGLDATWGDVERRCVAHRERVAELEHSLSEADQSNNDRLGEIESAEKRIADLEAKLAEAQGALALVTPTLKRAEQERDAAIAELAELKDAHRRLSQDYDEAGKSFERLSAAIAERDELRAEVKANAERLDTWRGQSADIRGALNLPHDAEWETVFRAVERLHAEVSAWRRVFLDEIPLGDSDPNDSTFWPAHWCNHEIESRAQLAKLRAEVERLAKEAGEMFEAYCKLCPCPTCGGRGIDGDESGSWECETCRGACTVERDVVELLRDQVDRYKDAFALVRTEEYGNASPEAVAHQFGRMLKAWEERNAADAPGNGLLLADATDLESTLHQNTVVTLPTDTTTPLDLAQRAVALMGGRVIRGHWADEPIDYRQGESLLGLKFIEARVGEGEWGARREANPWVSDSWGRCGYVTLAPEPEPERRKLTFGEAVEAIDVDHELVFRATIGGQTYEMRGYGVSHDKGNLPGAVVVWIDPLATVRSHRMQRITPAMLAAEWEAAS